MDLQTYIDNARPKLQTVEADLAAFDFSASNQQKYEALSREHQRLSRLLMLWDQFKRAEKERDESQEMLEIEEDPELLEVIRDEIAAQEQTLATADREIKALILPPHPYENRNIIVEIRPAAGGDEASLFAGDLYRMYTRFAEQKGWKTELLECTETDVGGIKDVAFSLQGQEVYRFMNYESGVHRVQRIPSTEAGGRIHTSTVTVAVLPEAEEVDIQVNNEDLRIDVFRSSGPGGQCVNTTDSAVRITHIPTGLSVASQQEKSQHRNREIAMRILRSRLLEQKQAEETAKNAAARRSQVGTGDRSERIRTYNFPQNRISDHRFGISTHDLPNVLAGNLGPLLEEIMTIDLNQRLSQQLK